MVKITHFETRDVRFPTSLTGDGSDAMNSRCDYSSAYITLFTDSELVGHGMTFTIGRGNDIVCSAIKEVAKRLLQKETEELFSDMGKTWDWMQADSQLRWIGPEKGVIHIATGAVNNALWDMFARSRKKPLWKLVVDMGPEELVRSAAWRYISDAITKDEAIAMLKKIEPGKWEREELVRHMGYPAYVTSAGWLGYSDEKIAKLTKAALNQGFNHFKMKVGANKEDDLRRGKLIRSIIDDPTNVPPPRISIQLGNKNEDEEDAKKKQGKREAQWKLEKDALWSKNPGPTGNILMIDANQVWDVEEAVEWVKGLRDVKPWFIEEPTAPDDILGHKAIRTALKPYGIGVATGEHAHNRMVFKQLLMSEALDVVQVDSCRLAGVSEVLSVLLMSAKFGVPVCPHAGGVGLCEYVIHLSLIDYICISGTMSANVLEYVDHLHEHFVTPCSINGWGRYVVPVDPDEGYSIEMKEESIREFEWPSGSYWTGAQVKLKGGTV